MGRFYLTAEVKHKIEALIEALHMEEPPAWGAWTIDFVESLEEKILDPQWYPSVKQTEKIEHIWEGLDG